MYHLGARSVLCIYCIRCAILRFLPYACLAWLLILAAVRDQLLCGVPFIVSLKVLPNIRIFWTKYTPKSFPLSFHPPIASALISEFLVSLLWLVHKVVVRLVRF